MIIDGKLLAKEIRADIKQEVLRLKEEHGVQVGLGAILVGDYAPSHIYVGMKKKACDACGIFSKIEKFGADKQRLVETIEAFNQDPAINGILLQLPLPDGFNTEAMIEMIAWQKDADGLHPFNMGRLMGGGQTVVSCTPAGVMQLLAKAGCDCAGKRAVVVGRSSIVGKPMAQLLMAANATVTVCHSKTVDLPNVVGEADILVAAMGRPEFIKGNWIKKGAYVIDVGTNRVADNKLVGDVEFEVAKERAGHITPVPGGVGPMTITMLLQNTLLLAKAQNGIK